ncbi:MAG: hypothetical protein ABI165_18425, partial [Bryobacteraceae bacterium]
MQTRTSVLFLTVFSLALLAGPASAFATPNFSGDWKLNVSKSEYGRMPAPESMDRKITHDDPNLQIVTTQS